MRKDYHLLISGSSGAIQKMLMLDVFFVYLPNCHLSEIARLEALQGAEINDAKIILANEVTKLCHGDDAANQANRTSNLCSRPNGRWLTTS